MSDLCIFFQLAKSLLCLHLGDKISQELVKLTLEAPTCYMVVGFIHWRILSFSSHLGLM